MMENLILFLSTSDIPVCQTPVVLQIIYFGKILINIVHMILPIGLIIYMMIDFSKCLLNGDESSQTKIVKLSFKRILYAVIVYTVPYIVSVFATVLSDFVPDYNSCITNATPEKIDVFTSQYEAAREKEEQERIELWKQNMSHKFNYTKIEFSNDYENFSQYDSRWKNYPLCREKSTIGSAGCGYVAYTMVLRSFGYKNVMPEQIVDIVCDIYADNTSKFKQTGYSGSGLSAGVLTSTELNDRFNVEGKWISKSSVASALREGKSIIVLMPGHWISILDINENGYLLVGDSAFGFNSKYKYTVDTLYEATNKWEAVLAFTKK